MIRRLVLWGQLLAWISITSAADQLIKVPLLQVGTNSFVNATVMKISATDASVSHSRGLTMIKMADLLPELQRDLGYDPEAAAKAAAKSAAAKANISTGAAPSGGAVQWLTSIRPAKLKAKAEGKCLLMFYDGGEFNRESRLLNQSFTDAQFLTFASANLILFRSGIGDAGEKGVWQLLDCNGNDYGGAYGPTANTDHVTELLGTLKELVKAAPANK